jgi:8-oxo-dGTP pyrophosphatase MutT (NUDIX family)
VMGRIEYWNDPQAPRPNSLVPACGVLASDELGRILLQRRRDTVQWAIPMGKMELGETPRQCAIRETLEETSVLTEVTGILGVYSRKARGQADTLMDSTIGATQVGWCGCRSCRSFRVACAFRSGTGSAC